MAIPIHPPSEGAAAPVDPIDSLPKGRVLDVTSSVSTLSVTVAVTLASDRSPGISIASSAEAQPTFKQSYSLKQLWEKKWFKIAVAVAVVAILVGLTAATLGIGLGLAGGVFALGALTATTAATFGATVIPATALVSFSLIGVAGLAGLTYCVSLGYIFRSQRQTEKLRKTLDEVSVPKLLYSSQSYFELEKQLEKLKSIDQTKTPLSFDYNQLVHEVISAKSKGVAFERFKSDILLTYIVNEEVSPSHSLLAALMTATDYNQALFQCKTHSIQSREPQYKDVEAIIRRCQHKGYSFAKTQEIVLKHIRSVGSLVHLSTLQRRNPTEVKSYLHQIEQLLERYADLESVKKMTTHIQILQDAVATYEKAEAEGHFTDHERAKLEELRLNLVVEQKKLSKLKQSLDPAFLMNVYLLLLAPEFPLYETRHAPSVVEEFERTRIVNQRRELGNAIKSLLPDALKRLCFIDNGETGAYERVKSEFRAATIGQDAFRGFPYVELPISS